MTQFVVNGLFRNYVEHMGVLRRFYMHTDDHSWHHVLETLGLPHDFDIGAAKDWQKQRLLEEMVQPANVGCGHIKGMLLYPSLYNTTREIPEVRVPLCVVRVSSSSSSLSSPSLPLLL